MTSIGSPGIVERRRGRRLGHPVAGDELRDPETLDELAPKPRRADRRRRHHRVQARQVVLLRRGGLDHRERHGRHEQRLGDRVALDGGQRLLRVEDGLAHDGAADEQRREQALDVGEDVVQRQGEQDPAAILERARVRGPVRAAQLHVVGQDDALRRPGRARRVDHGRGVVRRDGSRARVELGVERRVGAALERLERRRARPRHPPHAGAQHDAAQARDRRAAAAAVPARGQGVEVLADRRVAESLDGEEERGAAVAQRERELPLVQPGVERHRDRAGAADREHGGDERGAVGEQERDAVTRRHAGRDEPAGDAPRPGVEAGIGELAVDRDHERPGRVLAGDVLEGRVERPGNPRGMPRFQGGACGVDIEPGHGSSLEARARVVSGASRTIGSELRPMRRRRAATRRGRDSCRARAGIRSGSWCAAALAGSVPPSWPPRSSPGAGRAIRAAPRTPTTRRGRPSSTACSAASARRRASGRSRPSTARPAGRMAAAGPAIWPEQRPQDVAVTVNDDGWWSASGVRAAPAPQMSADPADTGGFTSGAALMGCCVPRP